MTCECGEGYETSDASCRHQFSGDISEKCREVANWIKNTKCHCTYECAMTYNVMSNYQYQPRLIKKALGL